MFCLSTLYKTHTLITTQMIVFELLGCFLDFNQREKREREREREEKGLGIRIPKLIANIIMDNRKRN